MSELSQRIKVLIDDDIEELVNHFAHVAAEYRTAKAKVEIYKRHRERLLAEQREIARNEHSGDGSYGRITVAVAEDRALMSDAYKDFLNEYETVLNWEAETAGRHDALEKRIDYLRSMLAFARAELSL